MLYSFIVAVLNPRCFVAISRVKHFNCNINYRPLYANVNVICFIAQSQEEHWTHSASQTRTHTDTKQPNEIMSILNLFRINCYTESKFSTYTKEYHAITFYSVLQWMVYVYEIRNEWWTTTMATKQRNSSRKILNSYQKQKKEQITVIITE